MTLLLHVGIDKNNNDITMTSRSKFNTPNGVTWSDSQQLLPETINNEKQAAPANFTEFHFSDINSDRSSILGAKSISAAYVLNKKPTNLTVGQNGNRTTKELEEGSASGSGVPCKL